MNEAAKNFIRTARAAANVRAANDEAVVCQMQARMAQMQADLEAAQARAKTSRAVAQGLGKQADALLDEAMEARSGCAACTDSSKDCGECIAHVVM